MITWSSLYRGTLLATLDPSAARALPQLIRAGDRAAIAVAGHVPDHGCRQAIADRLRVETEPTAKASIERAVLELPYLTVEAE